MEKLDLTWKRLAAVWWLMLWRGMLGGVLLGMVVGAIVGFLAGITAQLVFHVPLDIATYQRIGQVSSLTVCIPLGIVWGLVIVRMALRKKYGDFEIVLVPRTP